MGRWFYDSFAARLVSNVYTYRWFQRAWQAGPPHLFWAVPSAVAVAPIWFAGWLLFVALVFGGALIGIWVLFAFLVRPGVGAAFLANTQFGVDWDSGWMVVIYLAGIFIAFGLFQLLGHGLDSLGARRRRRR